MFALFYDFFAWQGQPLQACNALGFAYLGMLGAACHA